MESLSSGNLGETEQAYYRAIKDTKLNDINASEEISLPYSNDAFQDWVKRVDVYDLDKGKANFYTDEAIVTKFTDYRNSVAAELPKHAVYDTIKLTGQLKNIGSCQDGSKVGRMNEVDSLYVLDRHISVESTGNDGAYRIFWAPKNLNCEIKPRCIRKQFATGYEEVISKVPLPDCLKHAGYNSPAYSGLRYNGPAATAQFLTEDNSLLTWDMTPTFCLGREHSIYQEVRNIIQPALEVNPETMFGDMGIHLVPDPSDDTWRLSTAQLEADLLRELIPSVAPVRQALSNAKVLASEVKIWNSRNPPVCSFSDLDIMKELDDYLESREKELGDSLNQKLRYAHIWIPPEKRRLYHEDEKPHVSINTAAVKHILLTAALKRPAAFAGKEDKELVRELMIEVFSALGDPSEFSSPHAFLKGVRIPHISVLSSQASKKTALALSIKKQCRMLVSGAMTKLPAPAVIDIGDFMDEIISCVVTSEKLICGEYCFRLCVNPFQHPNLDRNIHRLTSLLTALSNTCGGVVQLNVPEGTMPGEKEFSSFKSRLLSLPGICEELVEISQDISRDNTSWAIITAKKCQETLFCKFGNIYMKFGIDINGELLQEIFSQDVEVADVATSSDKAPEEDGEGADVSNSPDESLGEDEIQDPFSNGIIDVDSSNLSSTVDNDDGFERVEFSAELNWDINKKNWDAILRVENYSTDEYVDSCDVWEPQFPMQVTPGRDSLKYQFPSDADYMETMSRLKTRTPGFAIANRSWASLLSEIGNLDRPPSHICDILTIAKCDGLEFQQSSICLWVIVSSSTEQVIQSQVQYMFIVGRAIKHQLSKQDREAPNLVIRCMLHSTHAEDNASIGNTLQNLGIDQMHMFLCSAFRDSGTFDSIKRCIALLLLSQESPIKTCAGNQMSVKLSAQQAKTLLYIKRKKVFYVSSAPGTGKTLCGLALYRDFGKENSVYICPTEPLLLYLRYNGCEATLVRNDEELNNQIEGRTFENKRCVIIDESHRLRCSKAALEKLFTIIKKGQMSLVVFADNSYQSFDRENQENIESYIHDLSEKVLGYYPHTPSFTEIYRNTRKVVSFLQHAMEDSDSEDVLDITCGNAHEGDGIQCIAMDNPASDNHSSNGLVQYLHPLLDTSYQVTDVAVLLDSGYTDDDINAIHRILQRHLPRVTTQSSATFPRKGIIVDRIESFAGLDAALCLFLLSSGTAPDQDATIGNPRYRVYLASRATHKAVFIVPTIDADVVRNLKFDVFEPAVDYHRLVPTGRKQTQAGYQLYAMCYSNDVLFVGEWQEVESGTYSYSLAVYRVRSDSGDITVLDRLILGTGKLMWPVCPRLARHTCHVFITTPGHGVTVARIHDHRLVKEMTLTCVRKADTVDAMSSDTVYVGDGSSRSVHVVDVRDDRITSTLEKPDTVTGEWPYSLAVLGNNIMVRYGPTYPTVVVYRHGSPAPVRVIPHPRTLNVVLAVNTDCQRHFLLTDWEGKSVFVMNASGNLQHTVSISSLSAGNAGLLRDCAVVNRQLWVGCQNGEIVVMSSQ